MNVNEKIDLEHQETRSDELSYTGYAFIKYTAIVIIVLAILYFIAIYIIPLIREAL